MIDAAAFAKRSQNYHQLEVDVIIKGIEETIRDASDRGKYSVIIDLLTCNIEVKALVYYAIRTSGYDCETHVKSVSKGDGLYIGWEPGFLSDIKGSF